MEIEIGKYLIKTDLNIKLNYENIIKIHKDIKCGNKQGTVITKQYSYMHRVDWKLIENTKPAKKGSKEYYIQWHKDQTRKHGLPDEVLCILNANKGIQNQELFRLKAAKGAMEKWHTDNGRTKEGKKKPIKMKDIDKKLDELLETELSHPEEEEIMEHARITPSGDGVPY